MTIRNADNSIKTGHVDCCQFLGLIDDSSVCYSYPHEKNMCSKVRNPEFVSILHQGKYCVNGNYQKCEIINNSNIQRLPPKIKLIRPKAEVDYLPLKRLLAGFLIFSLLLGIFYSMSLLQGYLDTRPSIEKDFDIAESTVIFASMTANAEKNILADELYTPTPLIQFAIFSTDPASADLSPTEMSTAVVFATVGPDMLTPFGPIGEYILYTIQPGESLSLIASRYESTAEVLIAINVLDEESSLWAESVIIVMPNIKNISGLSKYQIIKMQVRTKVADIAINYGVTVDELQSINSLSQDEWLPIGRWLIVPFGIN